MLATCPKLVWLPWLSWTNSLCPPWAYLIVLAARWLLHTGLPSSLATSSSLNWLKKIHASYLDHLALNLVISHGKFPGRTLQGICWPASLNLHLAYFGCVLLLLSVSDSTASSFALDFVARLLLSTFYLPFAFAFWCLLVVPLPGLLVLYYKYELCSMFATEDR